MTLERISWGWVVVFITLVLCSTVIVTVHLAGHHPYVIRFEMDENARAVAEATANVSRVQCLDGCHFSTGYISEECYEACTT